MKLYGSLTSPFVRACRMAAIELGLDDRIELTRTVVKPTEPNREFGRDVNPLRRVPALETDDGRAIVDSRVIIEFLAQIGNGEIIPVDADDRIDALNRHAIMSGATESLVLAMYENRLRPEGLRWPAWSDDQVDKARAALDWADRHMPSFERAFDIGAIALVCLAGYASFRFPKIDWLGGRPRLAAYLRSVESRRSVAETTPKE